MGRPVILDVDVGVDDALAIMLAVKSPELDVRAITTVSGNVHVEKTSLNALRVLEALGVSGIPVGKGMSKPLLRDLEVAEEFHGADGLGDSNLPPPRLQLDPRHAVDLLVEEAAADPGSITIIATGPLTNIAMALLRDPNLSSKVREVVIMGGAYGVSPYGYGNVTPAAEFNIYVDPEAARILFKSGIPVTAVGLDITNDPAVHLTRDMYQQIEQSRTAPARFVSTVTRKLMSKFDSMALHDPIAVAAAADPSLVRTRKYHIDIETTSNLTRGQTVADRRNSSTQPPNANICVRIDGDRFLNMFMERLVE